MESSRFDRVTRLFGAATSRRAGIGIAIAAITGATIAEPASAATSCRRGRQTCQRNAQCCSGSCRTGRDVPLRDRNRCTCEEGLALCGNACVDTDTDVRNCGACGNQCGAGDTCAGGKCRIVQQCYSSDAGLCYMTPDGREHRGDGLLIVETGGDWIECLRQSDCTNVYDSCALPGVNCTCVRAIDTGQGYNDSPVGNGACVAILDSGDSGIACQAEAPDLCLFSADGNEVKACYGVASEVGSCVDYACDGVSICNNEGVSCFCAIAVKYDAMVPFYVDFFMEPVCIAYPTADGLCPS